MTPTYQRIAYEGLDVANPTNLAAILALVDRAAPSPGDVAMDIGAGTGTVSVALALERGLMVHAVERDAELAEAIRRRSMSAGVQGLVRVHAGQAHMVLAALPPVTLMVALGTTRPAGPDTRTPEDTFRALAFSLRDGGHLLWGDLFWKNDPPDPLRRIIALTGEPATQDGWRAAGEAAGLDCVTAAVGSDADWDAYFGGADARVRTWLAAHPEAPEAAGIRVRADQVQATFAYGRPWLGFGLYLFRKGGQG